MLHEILPGKFDNSYVYPDAFGENDRIVVFSNGKVALKETEGTLSVPFVKDTDCDTTQLYYLFCINEQAYYTTFGEVSCLKAGIKFYDFSIYRETENITGFAIATAWHIYNWKRDNVYCGRCGGIMKDSKTERACVCTECGNTVYPKISPAVTVAIVNDDKILLAKSAQGAFRKYALVAGYVEIGETFEEAVKREVKEEVGLEVSDIRYYKNQPWGVTGAQMIGYFVKLKGSDKVILQEEELSEAKWFRREDIDFPLSPISLSYEMIARFRDGQIGEW